MSKQRFHTMTAIKSFVFKHLEDEHAHLTPDEFAEQFDLSSPDPMFALVCVCDDDFNAVELCYAANYRDRRERLLAGAESLFSPHPAVDISKAIKDRHVGGMIGRSAMIEIKPVCSAALDIRPSAPMFDKKNVIVINRDIDYKNNPFSPHLCGICNKIFCACLPFVDPIIGTASLKCCDIYPDCDCPF